MYVKLLQSHRAVNCANQSTAVLHNSRKVSATLSSTANRTVIAVHKIA